MASLLVTFKIDAHPEHNPRKKIAGECPVSGLHCTDITGAHHTVLLTSEDSATALSELQRKFPHITRIETL